MIHTIRGVGYVLNVFNSIRRTSGLRLSLWYSAIFILSSLSFFILAYCFLSSSIGQENREIIQEELKEFAAHYQKGGIYALKKEVDFEKHISGKNSFFVRLVGPKNLTLFLNIPDQWAKFDLKQLENRGINGNRQWFYLPAKNDEDILEIVSLHLPDGSLLQVGKSTEDREELLERFRGIFTGIMVPVTLIVFIGGAFLAFHTFRPIRNLIGTVRSLKDTGKMNVRVPTRQTGDELDELGVLFNGILEKNEALIKGMKGTLDNIAHDLRTPMTRFRGIAEIALQSNQNPEICQDALADCLEESGGILTMLNTLMDISEAETGTMKFDIETVNISALLEGVVELYRYVAEHKDIIVHTKFPKEIYLTADGNRIEQVLVNLLDNAIKYTPSGGRVDIEVYEKHQEIVISFKDTGIGIPPEELPRIWDRLYRGDKSRSERGLGLGLSLVKAIVGAHRGYVQVSSEPGAGSVFTVYLPV